MPVVQYDLPRIKYQVDADTYIHRLGRGGRAGHRGKCISFFNPNEDNNILPYLQMWVKNLPNELQPEQDNDQKRREPSPDFEYSDSDSDIEMNNPWAGELTKI